MQLVQYSRGSVSAASQPRHTPQAASAHHRYLSLVAPLIPCIVSTRLVPARTDPRTLSPSRCTYCHPSTVPYKGTY